MSKKFAPAAGEGIPTPGILAANTQSGNAITATGRIAALLSNEVALPMSAAVETLSRLEALFKAIESAASDHQIQRLASLGAYTASDICNFMDCARDDFEDKHTPVILAAVGGDSHA